jgi:hypothetical protein
MIGAWRMRAWLLPCLLSGLVTILWLARNPLRTWLEQGRVEPEMRMRQAALSWRQGGREVSLKTAREWARQEHRLRQLRQGSGAVMDVESAWETEWRAWSRQWVRDEDRRSRLQGQGITEADWGKQMRETLLDQAWLEKWLAEASQVTEVEIQAAYDQRRGDWRLPEAFRVAHLFLSGHDDKKPDREAEIRGIYRRLTQSEIRWEDVVRQYSEDVRTKDLGGDLGWFSAARMPEDLMAAVRALKPGTISAPIRTALGWHLLRGLDRQPARELSLPEIREELKAWLGDAKRTAALLNLRQKMEKTENVSVPLMTEP